MDETLRGLAVGGLADFQAWRCIRGVMFEERGGGGGGGAEHVGTRVGNGRSRTDEEDGVVLWDVIDGERIVYALEKNPVCLASFERHGCRRCTGVRE